MVPADARELIAEYVKLETDPNNIAPTLLKSLRHNLAHQAADSAAVSELTRVQGRRVPGCAEVTIAALGTQGEKAASAVPQLLTAFEPSNDSTKLAIVTTLGKIGPSATAALPLLTKLRDSVDPVLRGAAAEAIAAIARKQ